MEQTVYIQGGPVELICFHIALRFKKISLTGPPCMHLYYITFVTMALGGFEHSSKWSWGGLQFANLVLSRGRQMAASRIRHFGGFPNIQGAPVDRFMAIRVKFD